MKDGIINFRKNSFGGCVIVTGDWGAGSSGKGCLNSWLADKYEFNLATNNWQPNAGHYTELDDGTRILVQCIPSAFVDPNIELYINAGGGLDLEILKDEINKLESLGYDIKSRLTIHPHCNVITQEDKEVERQLIKTGSTFKGCGAALAGKTLRAGRKLAKDYDELAPFVSNRTYEINVGITKGIKILIEGSQGVDLDINHAEYPYVTSRQTTPAQLVADFGIPLNSITNIIGNLRTYPIRINNESAAKTGEICYTGNYWGAKEITWEEVGIRAGWNAQEFVEKYRYAMMTSVTKKIRRIFEFPVERMKHVNAMCGGLLNDGIIMYSLNFINFVDKETENKVNFDEVVTDKIKSWLKNNYFASVGNLPLHWLRTGPKHSQILEVPQELQYKLI